MSSRIVRKIAKEAASFYVEGHRWTTSRNDMKHYFRQFGRVQEVDQPMNYLTGFPSTKGMFVKMATPEAVKKVLSHRPHIIDGKPVYVRPRSGFIDNEDFNVPASNKDLNLAGSNEDLGGNEDLNLAGSNEDLGGNEDLDVSGANEDLKI